MFLLGNISYFKIRTIHINPVFSVYNLGRILETTETITTIDYLLESFIANFSVLFSVSTEHVSK